VAVAFGLYAFLNRNLTVPPQAWLSGIAMAASAEALLWLNQVHRVLPGYPRVDQPGAEELLGLALAGVTGVLILVAPGWAIGRAIRWRAGGTTPRLAWTIWPCWLLGSTVLRLYGPSIIR
jgi:hypothetical protein